MPGTRDIGSDTSRPRALLIQPPIYDFALYDLFLKPAGLLGVGYRLKRAGYDTAFINALDYRDPISIDTLGKPVRKANGTGKFFRKAVTLPEILKPAGRSYARYGIRPESLDAQISSAFGLQEPDIVFLGTGMTYWYPGVREVVRQVRRIYPGVPIVAGGVYATLLPEHCINICGTDYAVAGPAYPVLNGPLDRLGLPPIDDDGCYRVLTDMDLWSEAGVLILNRGCPFSCAYCSSRMVSGPFREGSSDALFETAEDMFLRRGTRNFAFYDDALLIGRERVLFPFLERVLEAGYPFSFYVPNAVHMSCLDAETAGMLRRSGFQEIRFGFESSSEDFHRLLDGKVSTAELDDALSHLRDAGFPSGAITVYILAGLPDQSVQEVEETVDYLIPRGVRISLSEYSPVPGSPLWPVSVEKSDLDLAAEPLFQNNTFFPMAWDGFTRRDLATLKTRIRIHNARIGRRVPA